MPLQTSLGRLGSRLGSRIGRQDRSSSEARQAFLGGVGGGNGPFPFDEDGGSH